MTDYQRLYNGISKAAWGYFFLYFNFNIGTLNVIPSFVGYLLFLSAIKLLKEEERELSLLSTLGFILTVWAVIEWIGSLVSVDVNGMWQFADIVISLVNLYFHFQLLTNMASIAVKHQSAGYELDSRLLRYRTLQTIMLTASEIVTYVQSWLSLEWPYISIIMMLVYVIAGICLMKALFELRKALLDNLIYKNASH